jgi:hypothetical protein
MACPEGRVRDVRPSAPRLPWLLFGVTGAASLGAVVFDVLGQSVQPAMPNALVVIVPLGYALMGALICARQPGNSIGWLYIAVGTGLSVASGLAQGYAVYALLVAPNTLPFGMFALWLSSPAFDSLFFLVLFLLLQLFPDGRPLTHRWRPGVWITVLGSALGLGQAVQHYNLDPPLSSFDNPYIVHGWVARVVDVADVLSSLLLPVGAAVSVISVVLRYRRSRGVERQQLRWFAAAVVAIALLGLLTLGVYLATGSDLSNAIFPVAVTLLPVATSVAILRYRLYEIDVLIRKTLVYGCLVAGLAACYLSGIILLGALSRSVSGESGTVAVTLSTLLVAVGFLPLRRRIQRTVDRRFYRSRYNADRSLELFAGRLREQIDLEALRAEVLGVVHDTLYPQHASLWLRGPPAAPTRSAPSERQAERDRVEPNGRFAALN